MDVKFESDEPTVTVGCPDWCKNTCIASCPTRALKTPQKLDPRLCISYMFYVTFDNIWLWKMNTVRAMGNSLNPDYVPDLIKAFNENEDGRVLGMIAWSLGRIGSDKSRQALEDFLKTSENPVKNEIQFALDRTLTGTLTGTSSLPKTGKCILSQSIK